MSDVAPTTDVAPPADAGAATTGGEAATDPTAAAARDVSEAEFSEVDVPESGAYGGIEQDVGAQDPTVDIAGSDAVEGVESADATARDVSEAEFAEINLPASDSQEDVLAWAYEGQQQSEEVQHALEVTSAMSEGAIEALEVLAMDVVDPANALGGFPEASSALPDRGQLEGGLLYAQGWIRVNAPELSQKLDRIFGKPS